MPTLAKIGQTQFLPSSCIKYGIDYDGNGHIDLRHSVPDVLASTANLQVFENIKTALNSVGGDFEHVVKITTYLTDIEPNADAYREVRAFFFANKAMLPASTRTDKGQWRPSALSAVGLRNCRLLRRHGSQRLPAAAADAAGRATTTAADR